MTTRQMYPAEIQKYLSQLDLESEVLSLRQRRTLRSQVEGHLEEALASGPGEPDVNSILANLGDPRELVREGLAQEGLPESAPRSGVRVLVLFALLIVGAIWAVFALVVLAFYAISGAPIPGWLLISAIPILVISGAVIVSTAVQLRKRRR